MEVTFLAAQKSHYETLIIASAANLCPPPFRNVINADAPRYNFHLRHGIKLMHAKHKKFVQLQKLSPPPPLLFIFHAPWTTRNLIEQVFYDGRYLSTSLFYYASFAGNINRANCVSTKKKFNWFEKIICPLTFRESFGVWAKSATQLDMIWKEVLFSQKQKKKKQKSASVLTGCTRRPTKLITRQRRAQLRTANREDLNLHIKIHLGFFGNWFRAKRNVKNSFFARTREPINVFQRIIEKITVSCFRYVLNVFFITKLTHWTCCNSCLVFATCTIFFIAKLKALIFTQWSILFSVRPTHFFIIKLTLEEL